MKKLLIILSLCTSFIGSAFGAEIVCKNAYVDTITVESRRIGDRSPIGRSLLVSFKTSDGGLHTCNNAIQRYVYLKADGNEAIFNAMTSIAFMARANNYKVRYMINSGERIFTADELLYISIVDNTALTFN